VIIEISDATTPMLSAIAQVSAYSAYEQMGKIGAKAKANSMKRMMSLRNRHHWFYKITKDGKRSPQYNPRRAKELAQRTELDGGVSATPSMGNFVTSNLMESSGVLVVGGRNKAKRAHGYSDGVKTPNKYFVPAVTDQSQSILIKLDQGKRSQYHGWGKMGDQRESMKGFRNAKYRANDFMGQGFRDTMPYMQEKLTTEYERVVGRAVNKVNVKISTRRIG
jgi:hypothetical protein